jgi:hypothetical protein
VAATERLPHIDEHSVDIEAPAAATWKVLLRVVESSFGSVSTTRFARLLDCADTASSGPRPLEAGSAFPGFHVERAEVGTELALEGSHRFSDYALIFRLNDRFQGAGVVPLRGFSGTVQGLTPTTAAFFS